MAALESISLCVLVSFLSLFLSLCLCLSLSLFLSLCLCLSLCFLVCLSLTTLSLSLYQCWVCIFSFTPHTLTCVCIHTCVPQRVCGGHMTTFTSHLFHHVGSRDRTQVVRLCSKYLYSLNLLGEGKGWEPGLLWPEACGCLPRTLWELSLRFEFLSCRTHTPCLQLRLLWSHHALPHGWKNLGLVTHLTVISFLVTKLRKWFAVAFVTHI